MDFHNLVATYFGLFLCYVSFDPKLVSLVDGELSFRDPLAILEKLTSFGWLFSSSCGELQPEMEKDGLSTPATCANFWFFTRFVKVFFCLFCAILAFFANFAHICVINFQSRSFACVIL